MIMIFCGIPGSKGVLCSLFTVKFKAPTFLISGAGYHMVLVKESHCDVNAVISLVKSHVPQADVESNVGAELSFVLPQDQVPRFDILILVYRPDMCRGRLYRLFLYVSLQATCHIFYL